MLKKMMTYNILFSNFSTEQSTPLQNFAPGGEERLFKANEELNKLCKNNDCVSRFIKMVKRADNLSLTRIRPFALADFWQLPRIEVLEVFLHASRLGIFNFKWEQMPLEDKSQEKDTRKFVEITFSVNPGVRNVSDTFFSKEMVTKHTICKGVLLPYEKRVIQIGAKAGIFKLIHANGSSFITVGNRRRKTSTIKLADIQNGETIEIGRAGDIFVKNENSEEQYFALEKIPHSHQAATAYEVTKMQLFNDLFSNEIMKVGEKICMESVTILFTDLRGSTKFYREMGDAQALGHVLSHFEILKHAIEREDGTIIKTIGDAVMATFKRPICAIKAMQNAQEIMKSSDSPLKLKAGIHYGHCIKIASDNYIDYFGNTVNYASRLEGLSHGNDIVISEEVRNDPEIVSLIDQGLMIADGMRANLKGFEDENTNLWRISTNIVAEEELQMSLFQLAS